MVRGYEPVTFDRTLGGVLQNQTPLGPDVARGVCGIQDRRLVPVLLVL